MDMNKSGFIEYSEFLTAASNKDQLLCENNLEKAFKKIDRNNDGCVSKNEMKRAFGIS